MQFFNPHALILLWSVPLVIGLFFGSAALRRKKIGNFGNPETVQNKLMPSYRAQELRSRAWLLIIVLIFSVLAVARPQWGEEKKTIERKGVDLIFLLDTSLSMLAEDVKPNRLEKSKMEIKSIVRNLDGDRIGMVAFAGSSFLQTPLTLDYSAFFLFLDAIRTGYIPDPGTSLDRAVRLAIRSFPKDQLKYKAVILFSDGEDHGGGIERAVTAAKEAGVRIYAVGVGTEEGDPIPLKDEHGNRTGYKKNRAGEVVITKLNRKLLEGIARETGGLYLPSTPGEKEVDFILKHMETLGEKRFKEKIVTEREDHYQLFLAIALFFLVCEMLVRKRRKAAQTALVIASFFLLTGFLESPGSLNKQGNRNFAEKKYQSAIEAYRKAQVKNPDNPVLHYNLGSTLYQTEDYPEANHHLEQAVKTAKDDAVRAQGLYNYGNTLYRLGKFDQAIKAYQDALEINPDDQDAKYNLEVLQKSKNRFEEKDKQRKKESQKQQKQQQKPKQQDNANQQEQQRQQDRQPEQKPQNEPQGSGNQQDQDTQENDQNQGQGGQDQPDEKQQNQGQQEQPKKPQDQGQDEAPARPDEQPGEQESQGRDTQPRPQNAQDQAQQAKRPLQGQMDMNQALRILDALKEGEKKLQDLRRPPAPKEPPQVAKDW